MQYLIILALAVSASATYYDYGYGHDYGLGYGGYGGYGHSYGLGGYSYKPSYYSGSYGSGAAYYAAKPAVHSYVAPAAVSYVSKPVTTHYVAPQKYVAPAVTHYVAPKVEKFHSLAPVFGYADDAFVPADVRPTLLSSAEEPPHQGWALDVPAPAVFESPAKETYGYHADHKADSVSAGHSSYSSGHSQDANFAPEPVAPKSSSGQWQAPQTENRSPGQIRFVLGTGTAPAQPPVRKPLVPKLKVPPTSSDHQIKSFAPVLAPKPNPVAVHQVQKASHSGSLAGRPAHINFVMGHSALQGQRPAHTTDFSAPHFKPAKPAPIGFVSSSHTSGGYTESHSHRGTGHVGSTEHSGQYPLVDESPVDVNVNEPSRDRTSYFSEKQTHRQDFASGARSSYKPSSSSFTHGSSSSHPSSGSFEPVPQEPVPVDHTFRFDSKPEPITAVADSFGGDDKPQEEFFDGPSEGFGEYPAEVAPSDRYTGTKSAHSAQQQAPVAKGYYSYPSAGYARD